MGELPRTLKQNQKGITGLETAIVLIAFVIVASVLAYVVLSAGLYSAQKAKEAVYAGVEEATSTLELKGDVIAKMVSGNVTYVYITLGTRPGFAPIDFTDTSSGNNKVTISFNNQNLQLSSVNWTLTKLTTINSDNLLDENEMFQITVDLSNTSNITAYSTFSLEIKPPVGAVVPIERTIPARLTQYVNLH